MNERCSGMTIVEVMLAVFLLGLSAGVVLQLVRDADLVRGRSYQISVGAQLAESEAERVRQIARMGCVLEDSTYLASADNLQLEVRRTVLREETYERLLDTLANTTVQVDVAVPGRDTALVSVRLIQGYQ